MQAYKGQTVQTDTGTDQQTDRQTEGQTIKRTRIQQTPLPKINIRKKTDRQSHIQTNLQKAGREAHRQ